MTGNNETINEEREAHEKEIVGTDAAEITFLCGPERATRLIPAGSIPAVFLYRPPPDHPETFVTKKTGGMLWKRAPAYKELHPYENRGLQTRKSVPKSINQTKNAFREWFF